MAFRLERSNVSASELSLRLARGNEVEAQVRRAWRIALGRTPDAEEVQLAVALVKRRGLSALCRALFNANELIVIE